MRGIMPLNINRATLYENFKGRPGFLDPRPLNLDTKEDRCNSNKYYKFHKDYDHLTEHCHELVVYFNILAKHGEIDEYLKNPRGCP